MTGYFMDRDSGCDTNSMNERTEREQKCMLTQPFEVVNRSGTSSHDACYVRQDRGKVNYRLIIKYVLFAVIGCMAFCAFVMSISNQRRVVTLGEPAAATTNSRTDYLDERIKKLNATIHHLVDTLYEDSDGHHDRINSTIHEHKSDLLEEIESLRSEVERLNQQLEEEQSNRIRLEAKVADQKNTIVSLDSKLQQLTARVANDAYSQGQLKQKVKNLESSVQALKDAYSQEQLKQKVNNLQSSVQELEDARAVSQNEHTQSVRRDQVLDSKIQSHHRPRSVADKAQGSLMMMMMIMPLFLLLAA